MPRMSRRTVMLLSLSMLLPARAFSLPSPADPTPRPGPCGLEQRLLAQGLVDVQKIEPALLVDLKYARGDNIMGEAVYGDLRRCYLQPEAALMLREASRILAGYDPGLRLLIHDGVRPRSVQRMMWEIVRNTEMRRYVADPSRGSMHNFGAAVDLTLATADSSPLDMGTGVDHFGILAHPGEEERLLAQGRLTGDQVANRRFLRQVMSKAGFRPLSIEWWHFDAFAVEETRRRFPIIE
jgi:zinc D-Ala-D-Ala dipeptidase